MSASISDSGSFNRPYWFFVSSSNLHPYPSMFPSPRPLASLPPSPSPSLSSTKCLWGRLLSLYDQTLCQIVEFSWTRQMSSLGGHWTALKAKHPDFWFFLNAANVVIGWAGLKAKHFSIFFVSLARQISSSVSTPQSPTFSILPLLRCMFANLIHPFKIMLCSFTNECQTKKFLFINIWRHMIDDAA